MGDLLGRLGQFIEEVKYVSQGAPLPEGFTHTVKLASVANGNDVVFAIKFRAETLPVVDLILAFA